MAPPNRRLRTSSEVRRVVRTGFSRSSERVVLYVAPGAGPSRAAWVTGKRVGGAVSRNRARRLLRETWRSLAPQVREGNDLVFVARRSLAHVKAPELIEEVENLLRGAGVMRS